MHRVISFLKNFKPNFNLLTLTLILLSFLIGWHLGNRGTPPENARPTINFTLSNNTPPQNVNLDFKLFWDVWNLVSRSYVDKAAVDPQKMYFGAIQGMVSSLGDPYTVFLPPSSQKASKEELGGSFEGVGIQLGFNKDKRLTVIAPLKDTPADKADIKPGDMIIKIGDKDTTNVSLPEAVELIRGPRGTEIALEIYREGEKSTRNFTLKRDTIVVKSVEMEVKTTPKGKKITVIKLARFGEKTFDEWDAIISSVLSSSPEGVVLDIRNNPGGFLEGAVYIASEFLNSGNVVIQEDGEGNRQTPPVDRIGKLTKLPLVVLINKGSASASEIVAGALQDSKRARLIGESSFGKGTIQSTQDLPDGTGIHITTAKWLTPNGHWIHNIGLTPDIVVSSGDDETKDPQLDKALELFDE